jgi:hypothetical protein
MSEASGREQMERRLVQRSLQDDDFRRRLLEDPKAAVEQELGRRLPEGVQVRAVEETPDTIYLVLPSSSPVGEGGEISDRELEEVAGGNTSQWMCTYTCPPPAGASAPCNCN